jgi:hypothetical protein
MVESNLVKGMKLVEGKGYVEDFESKKGTWETLGLPEQLI